VKGRSGRSRVQIANDTDVHFEACAVPSRSPRSTTGCSCEMSMARFTRRLQPEPRQYRFAAVVWLYDESAT
jgi:hypothetical protein